MKEAVIVSAVRTAVGKAPKGTLRDTRPDDLGAAVIKEAIARVPGLEASAIDDVIMGCAMPEAEQGMNVARAAAIRAGLPVETSAMTINRFCSSGLQTIAMASDRIRTNGAEVIIAGGLESMSMIPMGGHIIRPNPYLVEHYPDFYLSMGLATENLARKYRIPREEQDAYALRSQQEAKRAQEAGIFAEEIVPVEVKTRKGITMFGHDDHMRPDTTLEGLAKLRPAFSKDGFVTAGNASGIVDGAAALVIAGEDYVKANDLKPLGRIVSWAYAGVEPEIMGIGPVPATRKALEQAGLKLAEIDLIEVNEAFAAQYLAVEKELGLDRDRTNVNGGAIALGHPLGATGTRIVLTLLNELVRRGGRYGLATACIGGGQGIAMICERL